MTDETRKRPRIVSRGNDHHPEKDADEDFDYFAFVPADRLSTLKEKIEEREKIHFDLTLAKLQLDGNPDPGEHQEGRTVGPDKTPVPCQCGKCELKRVTGLIKGNEYAIRKLRALYSRLS